MARKKERPQGIAVHSEEDAIELARKNAHWSWVPSALQMGDGDEDPHELLNQMTQQERRDAVDFRQGRMEKCYVGKRIEEEELEEELARFHS